MCTLRLSLQLLNVQVPFFFKYAVDYFNKLPSLTTPEGTIITLGTALLLGCEQLMYGCIIAVLSRMLLFLLFLLFLLLSSFLLLLSH